MHIVVLTTSGSKEEAQKICQGILQDRLAACVNIIEGVSSYFWWEGKIDTAKENLLVIKTRKALLNKLIKKIRTLHSYDVPEIISLPIAAGSKKYLEWIDESTS